MKNKMPTSGIKTKIVEGALKKYKDGMKNKMPTSGIKTLLSSAFLTAHLARV